MAKWIIAKSEAEFPDPHRYLLWKNRHAVAFYDRLSLVKAAITNDTGWNGETRSEYVVFEWDSNAWQEIYNIPKGIIKSTHELWANGPAPTVKLTVNEDAVEAAIASIAKSAANKELRRF